jgi:uncharacterized membrane protein YqaE (UPF0057 family)
LLTSCLRNGNFIKKLFRKTSWEMISGNLINIMSPLILPWSFILMQAGVRDCQTKINTIAYLLVFFMVLVFSIYYFLTLLSARSTYLRTKELLKQAASKSVKDKMSITVAPRQMTTENSDLI